MSELAHTRTNTDHHNRYLQPRYPELCSNSVQHFKRHESTAQKPASKPETKNVSSASPEQRRRHLKQHGWTSYPRPGARPYSIQGILNGFKTNLVPGEAQPFPIIEGRPPAVYSKLVLILKVTGRISSIRTAGSNLLFITIYQPFQRARAPQNDPFASLQIVVDKSQLTLQGDGSTNPVKQFGKLVQKGDFICANGQLYRTSSGELSIRATEIPQLLSPCLHQIPTDPLNNESEHAQDRHVHMLADSEWIKTIHARSVIVSAIQQFMLARGFIAVQTPILAASAGGATARPFETTATEFSDRKLALRVAPELWLKKLLIGGMGRVFEIGQSFRNEGIDKTHNPEFTTCEFYAVNWDIEQLKSETEKMFAHTIKTLISNLVTVDQDLRNLTAQPDNDFKPQWPSIDFIPALNKALEIELPDLSSPDARGNLLTIFLIKGLPVPSVPTLPRLLDKLSSIYLEPQCDKPTWIVNTPECLSPLAKSFPHPDLPHQTVAARAELFIKRKEVVNCYEEENSPDEQRRKFIDQQKNASLDGETDFEAQKVDEDYLRALEWGLPPTGGWGCGIDRLSMTLLGKDKISDVLPFGNLRMVTHTRAEAETTEVVDEEYETIAKKVTEEATTNIKVNGSASHADSATESKPVSYQWRL